MRKINRIARNKELALRTAMSTEKIRTICNNKAPTPKFLTSNVVYEITCQACQGHYVGQTARHLAQRLKEHERGETAIGSHGCQVTSVKDASILYKGKTALNVRIAEAILIKQKKPELNEKEERTYNIAIKTL